MVIMFSSLVNMFSEPFLNFVNCYTYLSDLKIGTLAELKSGNLLFVMFSQRILAVIPQAFPV